MSNEERFKGSHVEGTGTPAEDREEERADKEHQTRPKEASA